MRSDAFFFRARVPASGFLIRTGLSALGETAGADEWLVPRIPEDTCAESGNPFDTPCLHRKFPIVLQGSDDLLEFAGAWGWLTPQPVHLFDCSIAGPRPLLFGESVSEWQIAAIHMQRAIHMWDAIRSHNSRLLRKFVHWAGNEARVDFVDGPVQGFRITENYSSILRTGDLIGPALVWLGETITGHLHAAVSPAFQFDTSLSLQPQVRVDSLLSALWLQLYSEIVSHKRLPVKCKAPDCPRWFTAIRSTKEFCSEKCGNRVRQKRKRRAATPESGRSAPRRRSQSVEATPAAKSV